MSSNKNKSDYDYVVTLSDDNFIVSDSIRGSLPEEFFPSDEDALDDSSETQVYLEFEEENHVGKLLSFESQNNQTSLCFEMRKSSALQLVSGKRFEAVTVKHEDVVLWSSSDVPKLKDTVNVDLSGSEALVTLTVRKIAYTERHK